MTSGLLSYIYTTSPHDSAPRPGYLPAAYALPAPQTRKHPYYIPKKPAFLYQCSQSPENSHLFCPVNYHRTYRLLSVNSPFPCCRCSHIPALCRSTPDQGNHNASAPPSELSGTDSLAPGPLPAAHTCRTSQCSTAPVSEDPE